MHYQVLSRKWRPQTFDQIVGQDHVVRSIKNALVNDQVGHAYLFTGTRGVGKTTAARIFAKALRCENLDESRNPCNQCDSCLEILEGHSMNVIEIDGASNNSVDDIRELINNVQFLPTRGNYKIYIIDEVHMLSNSAFNALLKTLEEPPAHVKFFFATTEPLKLPSTVLSRCHRFDFNPAAKEVLIKHLKYIADSEGFKFEQEQLVELLAKQARGSFRDSLSLLDQIITYCDEKTISEDAFYTGLGIAKQSDVRLLVDSIINHEIEEVSRIFRNFVDKNIELKSIISSIQTEVFNRVQASLKENRQKVPELMWISEQLAKDVAWIINTLNPQLVLEISLQKIALRDEIFGNNKLEKPAPEVKKKVEIKKTEPIKEPVKAPEIKPEPVVSAARKIVVKKDYKGFLSFLLEKSPAMSSNLEQGNVLKKINITAELVELEIGFTSASKVFYDYLSEGEVFKRLEAFASEFFEIDSEKLDLKLELIKEDTKFQSIADINRSAHKEKLEKKREMILNNPLIKQAENIFSSNIQRVELNEETHRS